MMSQAVEMGKEELSVRLSGYLFCCMLRVMMMSQAVEIDKELFFVGLSWCLT
jgi:hypothetical protein